MEAMVTDDVATMRDAFQAIYDGDLWSNGSGPGSHPDSTIEYRAFISRFMQANDVRTVTDFGCGDWQFSKLIDWSRQYYLGIDVVPKIVEENTNRFASQNIEFRLFNGIDTLPGGDLLLSKEVLQHLPSAIVKEYLFQIRQRYRMALLTNAIEPIEYANTDISAGGWRPLRLERAPFYMPGASVMTYFPQSGSHIWRNSVFLLFGKDSIFASNQWSG